MSKSSTTTTSKNPSSSAVPPVRSAWAKGPPATATSISPRSQSPAPTTSSSSRDPHLTHSRRPSGLGPVKDGVSLPKGTPVKQGSAVTFGSIGDVSAPISSSRSASPAPPLQTSSNPVKSFGSVPANAMPSVNGKQQSPAVVAAAAASVASSSSAPKTATPPPTSSTPPNPPVKLNKMDISKLFQSPSAPSPTPSDISASPATRPSNLPATPPTIAAITPHNPYTPFVPNGAVRPSSGSPGNSPHPPRSPGFNRQQMQPNGNPSRPPPNAPGGGPPQMNSAMSSPRLAPMSATGMPPQQPPMAPPPQMHWPGYYYPVDPNAAAAAAAAGYYHQPGWYMPQHPHHPQPPVQPHMPISPRPHPPSLPGPGTPTQAHAVPTNHTPHPPPPQPTHSASNSISSPPPTPSTAARLNTAAPTFVPGGRPAAKITLKSPDGGEVRLADLQKKSTTLTASTSTSSTSSTTTMTPSPSVTSTAAKRTSAIRIESPEDKAKRVAEEKAKEEKARELEEKKAREEAEKKRKEEEEKERIRKEEEDRKQKAAEEAERKKREAEEAAERKKKEEEEAAAEKKKKEEEEAAEKKRKEEEEAAAAATEKKRKEEEEAAAAAAAEKKKAEEDAAAKSKKEEPEEGEVIEESKPVDDKPKSASLRIDTAPTSAPTSAEPRKRPGPLDLSGTLKPNIPAALPSALATARIIEDIGRVQYPDGIKSPKIELNVNAKSGKFRYDRDFLLQFMSICKEKPDNLPPLDAIGLEPAPQQGGFPLSRGGSGHGSRNRTGSGAQPPSRQASGNFSSGGSGFSKSGPPNPFASGIGNFSTQIAGKDSFRSVSTGSGSQFGRPVPMQRTPSLSGTVSLGPGQTKRTRSKRGEQRNDGNKVQHGSSLSNFNSSFNQPGQEPVAPLAPSANRWDRKAIATDAESPEMVDRKVRSLLNKLTMEKFDPISDQIIDWANRSEKEKDGRTLIQVIRLVFEKATDEATWSEMYARLCRKMMETISPRVQDEGIKNAEGNPIAGGQLFRKYLLNRCQEDFERGWVAKEATAAAAASKALEDQAKAEKEGTDGEAALYSEEYYAAQKAKRQGLGLIKFIGELFKLQMLTERIMHECVKKLLGNVENPEEEEIESLCKLLSTVGSILDTPKARAHMDVYFSRMKELTKSLNVSPRMQFMLQDLIELRDRKWVTRTLVAAPATIAQIHEAAAKEKAIQETQRQMTMSRGGSKRGGDRGEYAQQASADGWTTAGNTGPTRPPTKAGDLSKFGKISSTVGAPATFGPASVFSIKGKEGKKESSLTRNSSNSNMFSMLSQGADAAPEPSKGSRPPSRKASMDFAQANTNTEPPQRKRLNLLPRSKPLEEAAAPAPEAAEDSASSSSEDEEPVVGMSEAEAKKKIDEDVKEFFSLRDLDEAETYLINLPAVHHPALIDKLVSSALESKETDARLVCDFFTVASDKELCTISAFEAGFSSIAEFLDDIAIDAPKAPQLMAIMMKGPGFEEEHRSRIASKSAENAHHLLS